MITRTSVVVTMLALLGASCGVSGGAGSTAATLEVYQDLTTPAPIVGAPGTSVVDAASAMPELSSHRVSPVQTAVFVDEAVRRDVGTAPMIESVDPVSESTLVPAVDEAPPPTTAVMTMSATPPTTIAVTSVPSSAAATTTTTASATTTVPVAAPPEQAAVSDGDQSSTTMVGTTTLATSTTTSTSEPSPVWGDLVDVAAATRVRVPTLGLERPVLNAVGQPGGAAQALIDSCSGAVAYAQTEGTTWIGAHRTACGDAGFGGVELLPSGDTALLDDGAGCAEFEVYDSTIGAIGGPLPATDADVVLQTSKSATEAYLIHLHRRDGGCSE